ncbi:MAG: hypothetical protein U9N85_12090 [Bacteroidota bacterium]|nr:hypothetical protein [Bacteroidota bacterium]
MILRYILAQALFTKAQISDSEIDGDGCEFVSKFVLSGIQAFAIIHNVHFFILKQTKSAFIHYYNKESFFLAIFICSKKTLHINKKMEKHEVKFLIENGADINTKKQHF